MLAPVIEQYVGENKDITVLKVDVDEEEALARRFGIMSIPTLILLRTARKSQKTSDIKPSTIKYVCRKQ